MSSGINIGKAYNKTMMNWLTWLSRRRFPYEPLISVEISKDRLVHNLNEFMQIAPNSRIAPVLKSNAYGHGLIEVAEILESIKSPFVKENVLNKRKTGNPSKIDSSIPFFVVDSYFEAIALRAKHIHTPILVIGYTRPETIAVAKLKDISFTVTNMETLRALAKRAEKENIHGGMIGIQLPIVGARQPHIIHLKIDTGMRRQGITPDEIGTAMEIIQSSESIILEGICSHLSDADNIDEAFTDSQIILWNKIVGRFRSEFPHLKYWHLSNTDGHRFGGEIDANISRLGIGLYGLADGKSFTPRLDLQPVLEMKTIISGIKKLKIGETVGYGNTFTAHKNMTVATVPVGYFEGVDRRLSNYGTILVGPEKIPCPIIGRVSMNITAIDVSDVVGVNVGMTVIVISNNPNQPNSMAKIAEKCDTITYEIAVKIPAQLKRVVVE